MFRLSPRRSPLRRLGLGVILTGLCMLCLTSSLQAANRANYVTVKVGDGPYFDFTLYRVAHALGLDHQLGLDLQVQNFAQLPSAQLRRGDIAIGYSAPTAGFPLYKNFSDYRDFLATDIFKGFVLVGRKSDHHETYEQYLTANHGNFVAAKKAFVLNQVKGKSICMVKSLTASTALGLMKQAGLDLSAIKIVDFADQAVAANAFVANQCDYYTGALPQEARLLFSSDFNGAYVAVAPQAAFGPGKTGQVFYSTYATTQSWLNANQATAEKLVAIWYRATRYLLEKPQVATPIIVSAIKTSTGGVFSPAEIQHLMTTLLTFPTIQQAKTLYFSKTSPYNFFASVNSLFANAQQIGQIPKNFQIQQFQVEEPLFDAVMANPALMKYINKPL
jgi:ABC-type nitrate/sulfonate/bicarbonate transport system substrate-binding protein